jgi:hypothetical protein
MGYTPAFDSIYTGTLYGKWPTAAVWASLLPLFDRHGHIDMSIDAIAGMTGWPRALLEQGIRALTQPDPGSRTGDHDGRRLVLIDPERPWGWKAVNHGKYREKARKMAWQSDQTAAGLDAERKARERGAHINVSGDVQTRPAKSGDSGDVPLSDGDGDIVRGREKPSASPRSNGLAKEGKGTRIGDWTPSAEDLSKITLPQDLDLDGERGKFTDYWRGAPGAKGVKADWPATWRNWVRRAVNDGSYQKRGGGLKWT